MDCSNPINNVKTFLTKDEWQKYYDSLTNKTASLMISKNILNEICTFNFAKNRIEHFESHIKGLQNLDLKKIQSSKSNLQLHEVHEYPTNFPGNLSQLKKDLLNYKNIIIKSLKGETINITIPQSIQNLILLKNKTPDNINDYLKAFSPNYINELLKKIPNAGEINIDKNFPSLGLDWPKLTNPTENKYTKFTDIITVFYYTYHIIINEYIVHLEHLLVSNHYTILEPENRQTKEITTIKNKLLEILKFYILAILNLEKAENQNIKWENVGLDVDAILTFIRNNRDRLNLIPSFVKVYNNLNNLFSTKNDEWINQDREALLNLYKPNDIQGVGEILTVLISTKSKEQKNLPAKLNKFIELVQNNSTLYPYYDVEILLGDDNDLKDKLEKIQDVENKMINVTKNEYNKLLTLYEKLSGAVRVVILPRTFDVKPPLCNQDNKCTYQGRDLTINYNNNSLDIINTLDKKSMNFGPFYAISTHQQPFSEIAKNKINIESICEYLSSGINNNLYLFTYGYSGAGKTTNLIGNPGNPGLMKNFYDYFGSNGNIKLQNINLLYGQLETTVDGENLIPKFSNNQRKTLNNKPLNITTFEGFTKKFTEITTGTSAYFIKSTPNNPQSSRGFLFFEFFITSKDKDKLITNKLCVVDMAGNEHPYDILIKTLPTFNFPQKGNDTHFLNTNKIQEKDFVFETVNENLSKIINSITEKFSTMASFIINNNMKQEHFSNITDFVEYFMFGIIEKNKLSSYSKKPSSTFRDKLFNTERPHIFSSQNLLNEFNNPLIKEYCNQMNYNILSIYSWGIKLVVKMLTSTKSCLGNCKNFWIKENPKLNVGEYLQNSLKTIGISSKKLIGNTNLQLVNSYCDLCKEKLKFIYNINGPLHPYLDLKSYDSNDILQKSDEIVSSIKLIINTLNKDMWIFLSFYFSNLKLKSSTISWIPSTNDVIYDKIYKNVFSENKNVDELRNLSLYIYVKKIYENFDTINKLLITQNNKSDDTDFYYSVKKIIPNYSKNNVINLEEPLKITNEDGLEKYFNDVKIPIIRDDGSIYVNTIKYFEDIVREGFYINQVNNELVNDILKPVNKSTSQICTLENNSMFIEQYDYKSKLNCTTSLQSLINDITPDKKNNLYVMLCALRTESDIKLRLGAINTLEYVKDLKST